MRRFTAAVLLLIPVFAHAATPQQRGFQVFRQVCSTCHSLNHVRFADLAGLGLPVAYLRAFANAHRVPDGVDDDGEPKARSARLTDPIGSPYPSEAMARMANHGDLPPDFSRLAMIEQGGAKQIATILQSYASPPSGITLRPGSYYNTAIPDHHIGMPPPLHVGQISFADGTKATVPQMAEDVAAFLDWVAHPHREIRSRIGIGVLVYLAILTLLLAILKHRVWKRLKSTHS